MVTKTKPPGPSPDPITVSPVRFKGPTLKLISGVLSRYARPKDVSLGKQLEGIEVLLTLHAGRLNAVLCAPSPASIVAALSPIIEHAEALLGLVKPGDVSHRVLQHLGPSASGGCDFVYLQDLIERTETAIDKFKAEGSQGWAKKEFAEVLAHVRFDLNERFEQMLPRPRQRSIMWRADIDACVEACVRLLPAAPGSKRTERAV